MISALAAIVVAGCGADSDGGGDPMLAIYVSVPLSGPAAKDGRDIADGARLALADAGGEAGEVEVEADYLDVAGMDGERSDPVAVAANARTATEDASTIAYVGELDSQATRTSLPITNSAGILQVAPGSGASDLVTDEPFNDELPDLFQGAGGRTFARLVPSDDLVSEDRNGDVISGPIPAMDLPPEGQRFRDRFDEEYGRAPGDWGPYGYEAMASVLAAIERADDPTSRSSVIEAYFDGTERETILGEYFITDTGETSLDELLYPLRVLPSGAAEPASSP